MSRARVKDREKATLYIYTNKLQLQKIVKNCSANCANAFCLALRSR